MDPTGSSRSSSGGARAGPTRLAPPGPPAPARRALRRRAIPRADLGQAHLLVGGASRLSWADPRVPAAWIAAEVLGGGVLVALWRDVREARGPAYHVEAHLSLHRTAPRTHLGGDPAQEPPAPRED